MFVGGAWSEGASLTSGMTWGLGSATLSRHEMAILFIVATVARRL